MPIRISRIVSLYFKVLGCRDYHKLFIIPMRILRGFAYNILLRKTRQFLDVSFIFPTQIQIVIILCLHHCMSKDKIITSQGSSLRLHHTSTNLPIALNLLGYYIYTYNKTILH